MSRVVPAGKLEWTGSESLDIAGYNVYYQEDTEPTYDSPHVDVGDVMTIDLPLEGQDPVEGTFFYGITAYDQAGNESDIVPIEVSLDTSPPSPPTDVKHTT